MYWIKSIADHMSECKIVLSNIFINGNTRTICILSIIKRSDIGNKTYLSTLNLLLCKDNHKIFPRIYILSDTSV